ncbi:hypothetical protein V3O24_12825 [Methylobacter sp. Wu8]|uniref:hypothetical protein n=1 Tax=Methylobacter sp. Wu8 TaxID=3118457 RepID=UPI002F2BE659|nr:hypothetical protein [Methylobacter tundripaludum]
MTNNKKAARDGVPQAALTTLFYSCHFSPILNRLKAAVYRLAPSTAWMQEVERCREQAPRLFFLGMLHG